MAKTESDVRAVGSAQTPRGVNQREADVTDAFRRAVARVVELAHDALHVATLSGMAFRSARGSSPARNSRPAVPNRSVCSGRIPWRANSACTRFLTAERIRDKIAASKRKGLWMGGRVPLGYDLKARQLVVNEAEAETVRYIFRRYQELRSVRMLKEHLDEARPGGDRYCSSWSGCGFCFTCHQL